VALVSVPIALSLFSIYQQSPKLQHVVSDARSTVVRYASDLHFVSKLDLQVLDLLIASNHIIPTGLSTPPTSQTVSPDYQITGIVGGVPENSVTSLGPDAQITGIVGGVPENSVTSLGPGAQITGIVGGVPENSVTSLGPDAQITGIVGGVTENSVTSLGPGAQITGIVGGVPTNSDTAVSCYVYDKREVVKADHSRGVQSVFLYLRLTCSTLPSAPLHH
jgi:hypothetical protein